jgi:hypothetical protein
MESGQGLWGVPEILLSCAIFFATTLYSFLYYRHRQEPTLLNLPALFTGPYRRILPMHLTIIAGGFLIGLAPVPGLDTNRLAVLFFLCLKTLVDMQAHRKKHTHAESTGRTPEGD